MNAVGIVVEYNPFHNGHAYHLQKTKEISEADVVIAVMSGPFLQRGEPALLPKWTRAKMALLAGVDLVLELPYPFATQKADVFARGAVALLGAIGCKKICFGSESGTIENFLSTLSFLEKNDELYQKKIKSFIEEGVSYPTAASSAFLALEPPMEIIDLSKPNNILGFQYVKAIFDLKLPMEPLTISRTTADYHDQHFSSESIASATSIRKAIFSPESRFEEILPYVPKTTADLLFEHQEKFGKFFRWEDYWPLLKFRILHATPEELSRIYEVEEGLENRIGRAALQSESFQEFMTRVKTKRYTWTRLQRMCTHILTNTTSAEMEIRMTSPAYLRLLGMTKAGRRYLNQWKSEGALPLVSKLSSYKSADIEQDIRAARIYSLGAPLDKQQQFLEMEYAQPPIYLEE